MNWNLQLVLGAKCIVRFVLLKRQSINYSHYSIFSWNIQVGHCVTGQKYQHYHWCISFAARKSHEKTRTNNDMIFITGIASFRTKKSNMNKLYSILRHFDLWLPLYKQNWIELELTAKNSWLSIVGFVLLKRQSIFTPKIQLDHCVNSSKIVTLLWMYLLYLFTAALWFTIWC